MCFFSTVPKTISFIGSRLALRTGSHAESKDTITATAKERITPGIDITMGISIPCDNDLPIPCKMPFNTIIPIGIPITPPVQS